MYLFVVTSVDRWRPDAFSAFDVKHIKHTHLPCHRIWDDYATYRYALRLLRDGLYIVVDV